VIRFMAISLVLFTTSPCRCETWFCATKDDQSLSGAKLEQLAIRGTHLNDVTEDKLFEGFLNPGVFTGTSYNIQINNKYTLIATLSSDQIGDDKTRYIYSTTLIIDKTNGNYWKTTLALHRPTPDKTSMIYGTCTDNRD